IRYSDEYVGKIIDLLKNQGIYEDMIIIISSDHGENQGELNVYGDHATACHITNHVPMIIKWPNINWKKEYDSLIYQTDIAATIVEQLGLKVPEFWDGRNIFNNLGDNENVGRDFLVISQNAWSCQRTVRFNNWTLINTYHTGLKDFPKTMLFDYEFDYHMLKNIADERPEIVEKGTELLETWHKNMMHDNSSKIDPMETVLKEGGPFHTRGTLKYYLSRLKKSGREEMVNVILDRQESYNL
ncbi:MAG: sulfatase-like hydrolase/transferase, partial [Candidatus Lokiarchaeota archaeon]|nr:sulfatase-like hydrolase/transferase [Candidatus Lokiarchaeota archaeon]